MSQQSSTSDAQTLSRDERGRQVRRVLWVTLALNIMVAVAKTGYGYWASIISLQADGFHTMFDAANNIIGLVALGIARKPPDREHPYGHKRFEVAASMGIGIMIFLGFLELGRAVWRSAGGGPEPTIGPGAYWIVVITVLVNLGISFWEAREGERLNSMLLKSDAAHTFSDSLAAGAVLVGIYLVDIGFPAGDTIAALAVMGFIGMTAYRVLRETIDVLVDSSFLDPKELQRAVEEHDAVLSCHYVRSRGMSGHIHVDLHLSLDPDTNLRRAGDIMVEVKQALYEDYPNVEDILIQLEPHTEAHVEDVPEKLI
jgi:cation diffusion facilitator family transporter